jgi:hypothetical protein
MTNKLTDRIFLPGPVIGGHTVTVSGMSNDYMGNAVEVVLSFEGDGCAI